jgi:hypothetical protein
MRRRASNPHGLQSGPGRAGGVLVEFALVSFVLMFLFGIILDFSRAFHGGQVLQQAADVMARELARTPLPVGYTFDQALADPTVRAKLYDESYLVINLDNLPAGLNGSLDNLPLVNQQLRPLMIYDRVDGKNLLRYPGAVPNPTPSSAYPQFVIYLVSYQNGAEIIDPNNTVPIVEEIRPNVKDPATGSFSLGSSAANPGFVQLRINYPFQAASLSNFQRDPNAPFEPGQPVIQASDPIALQPGQTSLYSGPEGLGQQYAWAKIVRPFRKVLSGQAIARRELFTN